MKPLKAIISLLAAIAIVVASTTCIRSFRIKPNDIIVAANDQADSMIDVANANASTAIAEAESEANSIIDKAEREKSQKIAEAKAKAEAEAKKEKTFLTLRHVISYQIVRCGQRPSLPHLQCGVRIAWQTSNPGGLLGYSQ